MVFSNRQTKPRRERVSKGVHTVRLKQYYQELPVYGSEIIVRMNKAGKLLSMRGEIVPLKNVYNVLDANSRNPFERAATKLVSGEVHNLEDIDTSASINKTSATLLAKDYIARESSIDISHIKTGDPELMIYNSALLRAVGSDNKLVWNIPVNSEGNALLSEDIKIDAHTGEVLHHESHIYEVRNRVIHDNENRSDWNFWLPGFGPFRSEGEGMSNRIDVDFAYDFYSSHHARDSYDDAGAQITATVRYCLDAVNCPFNNAVWSEFQNQMVYGDGWAVDDITAHEYTHAVTNSESDLIYAYQSGAINESLSDLWGEFIDLDNTNGDDSAAVRWQIGEDLAIGSVRNMATPATHGDADSILHSNYSCSTDAVANANNDFGGVHTNSGVNNKAVFLMTDGGSFNGYTISGIGMNKVAKIYYEAQTNLLTPSSNYYSLYNSVNQACDNLKGSDGISASNCSQVKNALLAVSMHQIPCTLPTMFINGMTGTVNVNSSQLANLSVSLAITTNTNADPYPIADYFIAFYLEEQNTWYSLNQQFQWTIPSSAAYQGPLVNLQSFPLPDLPFTLPAGTTVPVYFLVDLNPNNIFEEPYRFSVVNLHIN